VRYFQGTVKKTLMGEYACRRCGWKGRARVVAVGVGQHGYDEYEALAKADVDVVKDANRQIRRARCKRCGQRPPNTMLWYALPYALGTLAFLWVGLAAPLFWVGAAALPVWAIRQWPKLDQHLQWIK
jgi:hypothetical protein